MTSKAPIEIWSKILNDAIDVPFFFDPDPIQNYGPERLSHYSFQADYWQSERTRNVLRRVCRSWDIFLQPIGHRYIRMVDVYHGMIPTTAVPSATRLSLVLDGICSCMEHCLHYNELERMFHNIVVDPTDPSKGKWATRILEGAMNDDSLPLLILQTPHLEGVIGIPFSNAMAMMQFPGLPLVSILPPAHDYSTHTWPSIPFRNLTTLGLCSKHPISTVPHGWLFPALRHLSIASYHLHVSRHDFNHHILQILQNFGQNLVTFYYCGVRSEYGLPREAWQYIPKVERIQMPSWAIQSPSVDHSIRCVRITLSNFIRFEDDEVPLGSFPRSDLFSRDWVLRMRETWISVLFSSENNGLAVIAVRLAQDYRRSHIRFTDSEGQTLEEYIFFAIRAYWKCGRASRARLPKRFSIPISF